MELKLLEFYNAENARDKILQALDDAGFSSGDKEGARGLGEQILDIILQECWPDKYKQKVYPKDEACCNPECGCKSLPKEELDQIFDDFMNDRNPQSEIT